MDIRYQKAMSPKMYSIEDSEHQRQSTVAKSQYSYKKSSRNAWRSEHNPTGELPTNALATRTSHGIQGSVLSSVGGGRLSEKPQVIKRTRP